MSSLQPLVRLTGVSKHFIDKGASVEILRDVDLTIHEGETVAIIGPSGSGKSTILSLIAGLDRPNEGEVWVRDQPIHALPDAPLAKYRASSVGIIFQSFELIMPFTVRENILAPQAIAGTLDLARVSSLIHDVGLSPKADSAVTHLSGGEKQRVAIARALANNPPLILADEPTGSLDQVTGGHILDLLLNVTSTSKRTLVIITHDASIAQQMDTIYQLTDKHLIRLS